MQVSFDSAERVQAVIDKFMPSIPPEYRETAEEFMRPAFTQIVEENGPMALDDLAADLETVRQAVQNSDMDTITIVGAKYNIPPFMLSAMTCMFMPSVEPDIEGHEMDAMNGEPND